MASTGSSRLQQGDSHVNSVDFKLGGIISAGDASYDSLRGLREDYAGSQPRDNAEEGNVDMNVVFDE